jgi:hypothetical protein
MGLLDKLKGIQRPDPGTTSVPAGELRDRLLGLNQEQVPFTIGPGDESDDADVVAGWKIVDAAWYEVFARAGLEKVHRILLSLDEDTHEARALEESWEVSWRGGVPTLSLSAERFRGRTLASKGTGRAYAFTGVDPLRVGEAYRYRFDVAEMKDPIAATVTAAGWSFVPVLTKGKLRR